MNERIPEPDPHSTFEDEGIPDLAAGTPQAQWAVDPQEEPLPGDRPLAVDEFGTTAEELSRGESLDLRLAREEPEEQADLDPEEPWHVRRDRFGRAEEVDEAGLTEDEEAGLGGNEPRITDEGGLGVGSDLSTDYEYDDTPPPGWPAQPEEPSGEVWELPRPAGRIVAPDEGVREDVEPDEVAEEVGPDAGGYTAEEAAMRVEPE